MEYELKRMTWVEFDERRKTAKTVIIPTGACEVYGPHLPLGSDILVAQGVARLVAERVNGIVSPVVEVGQSAVLDDFPGTIVADVPALTGVYSQIVESFIKWGFNSFFIISAHLNNTQAMCEMMENFRKQKQIRYAAVGWWQYLSSICGNDVFESETPHTHASEAGTSVMEYLYPELVRRDKLCVVKNKIADSCPGIAKALDFHCYTDLGTIGDSTVASPEKGKIIVDRAVDQISDYILHQLEQDR